MRTASLVIIGAGVIGASVACADEVEDLRKRVEKLEEATEKNSDRDAQAATKAK
jgi:L-2-hydroxyglutarate oxidase LhgO